MKGAIKRGKTWLVHKSSLLENADPVALKTAVLLADIGIGIDMTLHVGGSVISGQTISPLIYYSETRDLLQIACENMDSSPFPVFDKVFGGIVKDLKKQDNTARLESDHSFIFLRDKEISDRLFCVKLASVDAFHFGKLN